MTRDANGAVPGTFGLAVVLVLATAFASAGCARESGGDENEAGEATNPAVVEVTLTRVTRAPISRIISISGTVTALPNQDVRVSAMVAGRVSELPVAEGDRITAGQLVARIDDRPLRDQLAQAEASLAQARANLENARRSRARNETLLDRGIAARKEVEDARTQETVAEATQKQAEATVSLARLQLSRAGVRSPLDGSVVKRFVSVGEQVDGTAAQPLVEIAENREVEIFANVPAPYLAMFREGESVDLAGSTLPGGACRGRVTAVSTAVDPATNVGLVRIRVANDSGALRLGMFLSAEVSVETHPRALVIPPQALYRDQEGRPHVYRVEGDTAAAVSVVLGIETSESDEILSGVSEGDAIIRTGGYGLGETSRIRVKTP